MRHHRQPSMRLSKYFSSISRIGLWKFSLFFPFFSHFTFSCWIAINSFPQLHFFQRETSAWDVISIQSLRFIFNFSSFGKPGEVLLKQARDIELKIKWKWTEHACKEFSILWDFNEIIYSCPPGESTSRKCDKSTRIS